MQTLLTMRVIKTDDPCSINRYTVPVVTVPAFMKHFALKVEIEMWRTPVLGRLTSSVSVVSDFVANGYQTMQHVSTSPPAIPDGQISRVRF